MCHVTELSDPMTAADPFYTDLQPWDIVYYNPLDGVTVTHDQTSSVFTLTTSMGESPRI
ncbi:hypothetical protein HWD94_20015 [Pseudarthrobacter equi]|uniref:hypothetical protein n=1 Tax=Pseudarthrobacter equi TaxID=728066 RepID=UPI0021C1F584|nr:hypothetical protein [Pseudarthrobacter equi]MCT9627383.1 hypothetical protein [Pseudarthrobacter equi]